MKLGAVVLFLMICSAGSTQTISPNDIDWRTKGAVTPVGSLPTQVDWRSKGAVTPVKNQGTCGSDYAFAAIAAIEGADEIATGQLRNLSEQEIVDCSIANGNYGCAGGWAGRAMEWVAQHGVSQQGDYPYTGRAGTCRYDKIKPAAYITRFRAIPVDAPSLMEAVARQPVAVLVDASGFHTYKGGIYDPCRSRYGDHWVTIVGYSNSGGAPYWIIKNSWGTQWGISGYMLMSAGRCKDIFEAVVPEK